MTQLTKSHTEIAETQTRLKKRSTLQYCADTRPCCLVFIFRITFRNGISCCSRFACLRPLPFESRVLVSEIPPCNSTDSHKACRYEDNTDMTYKVLHVLIPCLI